MFQVGRANKNYRGLGCDSYNANLTVHDLEEERSKLIYSMSEAFVSTAWHQYFIFYQDRCPTIQKVQAYEQQAKIGLHHLLKIHASGLKFTKTQILLAS